MTPQQLEQVNEAAFVELVKQHELGPRKDASGNWVAGELNTIFHELADTWVRRNQSSNERLAEHLDIRPQSCSQWKYGTAGRKPTFSSLVMLVGDLNMQMVLDADGLRVIRRRTRRS